MVGLPQMLGTKSTRKYMIHSIRICKKEKNYAYIHLPYMYSWVSTSTYEIDIYIYIGQNTFFRTPDLLPLHRAGGSPGLPALSWRFGTRWASRSVPE